MTTTTLTVFDSRNDNRIIKHVPTPYLYIVNITVGKQYIGRWKTSRSVVKIITPSATSDDQNANLSAGITEKTTIMRRSFKSS